MDAQVTLLSPTKEAATKANGKPKVLIIDDRRSSRESVSFALSRRYDCLMAESAEDGLEMVDRDGVSVVILDIRMPGLNGIEALRRIKEKDPSIEVIMLTGYASLETAKQSITYGAYGYLTKPFDLPDLRATVDKACQKRMESLKILHERDSLKKAVTAMQKEMGNLSRLADVGWVSAGVVHEMKSPLTAILGYAEMMLRHIDARHDDVPLPADSARYLNIIKKETVRCAEMAKSLLEAARSGQPHPQIIPVSTILTNVHTLIRPQVHINHIQFRIDKPDDDLQVHTDPDDVLQVLLNLALNAIHAMNSEPKELRIATFALDENRSLPYSTERESQFLKASDGRSYVAVEVQDSGPGIPPERIEHIFEPFYTTLSEESCAGLGLSICKEKMERNAGHIDVAASSSEGTTIRLLIPRPTQ